MHQSCSRIDHQRGADDDEDVCVANGLGIKPVIGDDGIIRSDGTTILAADDLSGVVALIDCARRLKASGKKFPRVEFLFTIAEEAGLYGSKYFDVSKLKSKVGYAFDSPGRMGRVVCTAPGQVHLFIEVEGRAAHAGNCPEEGVNATVVLAKILANIRDGRLDPRCAAATRRRSTSTSLISRNTVRKLRPVRAPSSRRP